MNPEVARALENDLTIDITTIGRKSGKRRRIEIWFHNIDGRLYITGTPGTRDWYANLVANPSLTFHLKSVPADLEAEARLITEPGERRAVLEVITERVGASGALDRWLVASPLVEVSITEHMFD